MRTVKCVFFLNIITPHKLLVRKMNRSRSIISRPSRYSQSTVSYKSNISVKYSTVSYQSNIQYRINITSSLVQWKQSLNLHTMPSHQSENSEWPPFCEDGYNLLGILVMVLLDPRVVMNHDAYSSIRDFSGAAAGRDTMWLLYQAASICWSDFLGDIHSTYSTI